jgi:hypothetical protein
MYPTQEILRRLANLEGDQRGGGAAGDTSPYSVVLRPGGVAGGNVFTSWASLYAACAGIAGGVRVIVENTGGIPHIPAGDWAIGGWAFDGGAESYSLTGFEGTQLIIDDGAHFTGDLLQISFRHSLLVFGTWTSPVVSIGTNGQGNIFLHENAQLAALGASPFMAVTDTGNGFVLIDQTSVLGDGAHAVFTSTAQTGVGNNLVVIVGSTSTINADAVQTTGVGGVAFVQYDAGAIFTGPQTGATLQLNSQAAQLAYTPANPAFWQPAPTEAAAALDQLAAPNVVEALAGLQAGVNPATITTPAIAKKRSGRVLVTGVLTVTGVAAGTMTVTLLRDATPIGPTQVVPITDGGTSTCPITWVDTLPDNANHTYTYNAVPSAGTLTVSLDQGSLIAQEL